MIEELRMYQDNPQDYVQILFDEVMWPDHPLGWDVAGREETVPRFTAEDCRDHLARAPDALELSWSASPAASRPRMAAEMIDGAIGSVGGSAARAAGRRRSPPRRRPARRCG